MKKVVFLFIIVLITQFAIGQTQVGDATLPNKVTMAEQELVLNGAGMREKLWIDLYSGGLYLESKSNDAEAIINSDASMVIKLHIVSKLVTQEKMINAVNEGFMNATSGRATAEERAKFIACFNEEIVKGNIFDIVYENGITTVYKNGVEKGTISGLEFKKALFAIWLGKKPADKDLKEGMLGE